MADEFDLIARYFAGLTALGPSVCQGIGDDCARVQVPAGHELALSIDTLTEGVHFPACTDPADVGWKTLACGLSDLAAGGAEPAWCLLALGLPAADSDWLTGLARGLGEAATAYGVSLIGGDTTRSACRSLTLQIGGLIPRGQVLSRAGARPGDLVCVSGAPGEAAMALHQLQARGEATAALRKRLDRPSPRVALGQRLRGSASACIDVSDGLGADAAHIAHASGVELRLEAERLPISPALAEAAAASDRSARDWLLHGGDDYELCFTIAASDWAALQAAGKLPAPVTMIGHVRAGAGVTLQLEDGTVRGLEQGGYRHFAG